MSFKSLPAGAKPLRLESAASGVMSFLGPTDAGDLPTIVLNIVASRDDFDLPIDITLPPIALSADGAIPVPVPVAPDAADISNGSQDVASAGLTVEEPGIYQVVISVLKPVSIWEVRVTNPGEEALNFTSTVATNENEARQPWIDLPPSVNFRTAVAGEMTVASVRVGNRGSKKLTVRNLDVVTEIDPHDSTNIDISFSVSETGNADTQFFITSDASNNQSIRLQGNVVPKPTPTPTPFNPGGGGNDVPLKPTELPQ
jgi:hypothetical protein